MENWETVEALFSGFARKYRLRRKDSRNRQRFFGAHNHEIENCPVARPGSSSDTVFTTPSQFASCAGTKKVVSWVQSATPRM